MSEILKVGITHGDFNGIGYEVILKALEDNRILELCTPVIYGSSKIALAYRKMLELPSMQLNVISSPEQAREGAYNIINVAENLNESILEPGKSTEAAGKAAFAALERATADLRDGTIDLLVTAPINKHNIQSPVFSFPGHTEYLEASVGDGARSLMILFNDRMRVALATTHLPITQVASKITRELILERLSVFSASLSRDFAIVNPRIAVLALNPHAGEEGLLGTEESEIILPAITEARAGGIQAYGPYAADGFFGSGNYTKFDGILAMYHDQGLAPFKLLAMDDGVNFTAGLPVVRTSPDHGTGYDIVGQGIASPDSMRNAIYAGIDIVRNRRRDDEIHNNPLRRHYFEKGKDNVVLDLS